MMKQRVRASVACALLGTAIAASVAVDAWDTAPTPSAGLDLPTAPASGSGVQQQEDADQDSIDASTQPGRRRAPAFSLEEVFAQAGGFSAYAQGVPPAFEQEVASPQDVDATRVLQSGDVVALVCDRSAQDALAAIDGAMKAKGWDAIVAGQGQTRSYAKNGGTYQWAHVSATEPAGESCIVFVLGRG